jgi:hypothetical protein
MIKNRKYYLPQWWIGKANKPNNAMVSSGRDPAAAAFVDEIKQHEPFKDIFDGLQRLNEMIDENVKGFAGR